MSFAVARTRVCAPAAASEAPPQTTHAEHLTSTGVQGIFGQQREFSTVLESIAAAMERAFAASETLRFPPLMARADLNRIGYFRNFPQLLGSVHCFCGDEHAHHKLAERDDAEWTTLDAPTDLVLTPAACYPLYPILAARGPVPAQGHRVQVRSHCFRREPSAERTRMQSFQMQELVCAGSKAQASAFQAEWMERGVEFFTALDLPEALAEADDPFFGRAASVMRKGQRASNLKYELVVPINSDAPPTACMSFNYHVDHFGRSLSLTLEDGACAHTACTGIGLERTTLALFHHHGETISDWPRPVRAFLRLA